MYSMRRRVSDRGPYALWQRIWNIKSLAAIIRYGLWFGCYLVFYIAFVHRNTSFSFLSPVHPLPRSQDPSSYAYTGMECPNHPADDDRCGGPRVLNPRFDMAAFTMAVATLVYSLDLSVTCGHVIQVPSVSQPPSFAFPLKVRIAIFAALKYTVNILTLSYAASIVFIQGRRPWLSLVLSTLVRNGAVSSQTGAYPKTVIDPSLLYAMFWMVFSAVFICELTAHAIELSWTRILPVSALSLSSNDCLANGLSIPSALASNSDELNSSVAEAHAFRELAHIARYDPTRRKVIINDIDRPASRGGPLWSQIANSCINEIGAIVTELRSSNRPPAPVPAPAPASEPVAISASASTTSPKNPAPSDKSVPTTATTATTTATANSVNPTLLRTHQPSALYSFARATVAPGSATLTNNPQPTPGQELSIVAIVVDSIYSGIWHLLYAVAGLIGLTSELSLRKHELNAAARRFTTLVKFDNIFSRSPLAVWSCQALGLFTAASVSEDLYGSVQNDLPRIIGSLIDLHETTSEVASRSHRTVRELDVFALEQDRGFWRHSLISVTGDEVVHQSNGSASRALRPPPPNAHDPIKAQAGKRTVAGSSGTSLSMYTLFMAIYGYMMWLITPPRDGGVGRLKVMSGSLRQHDDIVGRAVSLQRAASIAIDEIVIAFGPAVATIDMSPNYKEFIKKRCDELLGKPL
ncbi:hypothetical protein GQ42DRAFT_162079 [Ramicandelaber brevisporus]|nr:hypothetical protein GQ42DRAFT_162079 [Ramicandelaber brevisporus]